MNYQPVRARIVRAGSSTAHLSIPAFAGGQILVPVPTDVLTAVTRLPRVQLPGTELTAKANVAAATEKELSPHDWQLHSPSIDRSPDSPTAASPAA